jgi:hypothetical protein
MAGGGRGSVSSWRSDGGGGLGRPHQNDPLSIDGENESEVNSLPNAGESSTKEPQKKAKVVNTKDDALVNTLKDGFKMMVGALVKSGGDNDDKPNGLWMLWWPLRDLMTDI